MVAKISIPSALSKLNSEYRAIVQKAAGNQVLTPKERDQLESSWARSALPKKQMSVDTAMKSYLGPKLEKALFAVSSDKKSITPSDAHKLYVTELRASAEALFGVSPKLAQLKAASAKAWAPYLDDMNRGVAFQTFPSSLSLTQVMSEIIGFDYDPTFAWDETLGAAAIQSFAELMHERGLDEKTFISENEPDTTNVTGDQMVARFDALADEVKTAFKPLSAYKAIHQLSHATQEDGDGHFDVLLAQKKDNSWVTLTWHNFPF